MKKKTNLKEADLWARRRQLGIPTNKKLFVLACMDERLPVSEALGLEKGDAHIFRNAGGIVTDDAIRSAMLSTQFSGTKEIIIINHTECGLMMNSGEHIAQLLRAKHIDIDNALLNPDLPELKLENRKENIGKWIQTFTDVDATCERQIELMKSSPLIPDDVQIHGFIWEVETMSLRRPYNRLSD